MARNARGGGPSLGEAYATPGLGRGATIVQVLHRFRELALRHHPDRGGKSSEFARIRRAYEAIVSHHRSQQGSGAGRREGPGSWLAVLLDLAVRLIRFIDEQPWSGLWKAIAAALVVVGGAVAIYSLTDRSGGNGQRP